MRRWKVWHLAALVALVAFVMVAAVQVPGLLLFLGISVPPIWLASTWDPRPGRPPRMAESAAGEGETHLVQGIWVLFLLVSWPILAVFLWAFLTLWLH